MKERFRDSWSHFDPEATGFMGITELPLFLLDLGEPLGWGPQFQSNEQAQT